MMDLIRTILLAIAIYSGAIAAGSERNVNIPAVLIHGAACSVFVITKDKKKYEDRVDKQRIQHRGASTAQSSERVME